MAEPTKYAPSYSFTGFQAQNPTSPLPAPRVDDEFANIAVSVGEVADALSDVRRSDGALRNQVVTPDSLSAATRSLLTKDVNPRGEWGAASTYTAKDAVTVQGATYLCVVAHTAGADFSTDLEGGYWLLIASPYSLSGAVYSEVFSGNGSQTAFTLAQEFQSIEDLQVYVQNGTAGYELVRGVGASPQVSLTAPTRITFASAPGLGTRNIIVMAVNQAAASSAASAQASATAAASAVSVASASASDAASSASSASASAGAAGVQASAASASAADAEAARLAAEAAANNIAIRDIVFKTFADSPISVNQSYSGKLIAIDTSGGPVVVNLAAIASLTLPFNVALKKSTGDANSVTVNPSGSDTIDGASPKVIAALAGTHLYPDLDPSPDQWVSVDFGATAGNLTDEVFISGVHFTAGVTTSLSLSQNYGTKANIRVHFDAAYVGSDEISLSGTTLSFPGFAGGAIPLGVSKVYVNGGTTLAVGVPADGTVSTVKLADGALSADASGRGKVADGFATAAKLAPDAKPYDIGFVAAYGPTFVAENAVVQTYGKVVAPRAMVLEGEAASINTAPTGSALILDVERNGSSVYSSKPMFASGSSVLTAGTLSAAAISAGDVLTFKVTQIGSSNAGSGVVFTLKGRLG